MTFREANDLLYEDDENGYKLAFDAFGANYKYYDEAESICDNCIHTQCCQFTEINDYSDNIIVGCNFFEASTEGEASK